jgi:hypothetical protein
MPKHCSYPLLRYAKSRSNFLSIAVRECQNFSNALKNGQPRHMSHALLLLKAVQLLLHLAKMLSLFPYQLPSLFDQASTLWRAPFPPDTVTSLVASPFRGTHGVSAFRLPRSASPPASNRTFGSKDSARARESAESAGTASLPLSADTAVQGRRRNVRAPHAREWMVNIIPSPSRIMALPPWVGLLSVGFRAIRKHRLVRPPSTIAEVARLQGWCEPQCQRTGQAASRNSYQRVERRHHQTIRKRPGPAP